MRRPLVCGPPWDLVSVKVTGRQGTAARSRLKEAVGSGDAWDRPLCEGHITHEWHPARTPVPRSGDEPPVRTYRTDSAQRVPDLGGTAGTGSSGSRSAPKASSGTTGATGSTAAILR